MPTGQFEARESAKPDSEIDEIHALPTMEIHAEDSGPKPGKQKGDFHNMRTMEMGTVGGDDPAATEDLHDMKTMQVAIMFVVVYY